MQGRISRGGRPVEVKGRICPEHKVMMHWVKDRAADVAWAYCPVCGERPDWIEDDHTVDLDALPSACEVVLRLIEETRDTNNELDRVVRTMASTKEAVLDATIAVLRMKDFITRKGLWEEYLLTLDRREES